MRQLMCTAVSQIRSDQLVPLHHYAHLMYPACLFFLLFFFFFRHHVISGQVRLHEEVSLPVVQRAACTCPKPPMHVFYYHALLLI
jgi:hypothetical protein